MPNDSLITIAAGPASVSVDTRAGGRLSSWTVNGIELLVGRNAGNHPFGWGSYVMVPFAGRIRRGRFCFEGADYEVPVNMAPHAIHGLVYDRPWEVLAHNRNTVVLGVRLGTPWPFTATVTHIIQLHNDRLTQQVTVTGGPKNQPVSFGWHPWFRRSLDVGDPLEFRVDTADARIFTRDADNIATNRLAAVPAHPWDDCFQGLGDIELSWPGALTLHVEHDCPVVVLYDPEHAVCVEPQSAPPDAVAVDPEGSFLGASASMEHTVTWKWNLASRR
jgi:aldose 1-epimerase